MGARGVQCGHIQLRLLQRPVVGDDDCGDGAEQAGDADQPGLDVGLASLVEPPRLAEQAKHGSCKGATFEGEGGGEEAGQRGGWGDYVGRDIGGDGGEADAGYGEDCDGPPAADLGQEVDRVGDGVAEDKLCGGGDGEASEGGGGREEGQANPLNLNGWI